MLYEHSQLQDYWIWTRQFPVPFCEAHIKKFLILFQFANHFMLELKVFRKSPVPVLADRCVNTTRSNCCATMIPSVQSEVINLHRDCVFDCSLHPTKLLVLI